MRAGLAVLIVSAFAATAAAQDSAPANGRIGDVPFQPLPDVEVSIEAPTPPVLVERRAVELTLPALPEVEVALPDTFTPADLPAAPQLAITQTPRPTVAVPDLPQPEDPFARIAMMPAPPSAPTMEQQASAPVPVQPEVSTPKAPVAIAPAQAPPVTTAQPSQPQRALQTEALDRALAELLPLQALPASIPQGVRDFYARRDNAPVWTTDGQLTPAAMAILARAGQADEHGLNPARFQKLATVAASGDATPEKREAAVATLAALYARDARGGRINPQQVSRLITATLTLPDTATVLDDLARASRPADALEAYNPAHAGYKALKAKLADMRAASDLTASVAPKLTFGVMLTTGMTDERVPLLRSLLALPPADSLVFDAALSEAVRTFQRERGLRVSGRLDRATVATLGGIDPEAQASRDPKADIIANMERWRWLPTELGTDHVFVNIPSYSLTLMRAGVPELKTRVIVGKPQNQTPVFSHRIQFLVVNPSWNVPPSIAMKELLPLLQKNPNALAARGLQVISRGKVVDPSTVNWSAVGRTVAIRQPPGERNALGNIKFMFPNEHAVYLHDTPSRGLFVNDRRAYSHGCVRVQDPFRLAEALLGAGWSEGRLKAMIGGGERQVKMPADVPVHLAYFTMLVDEAGTLQSREDIYGHNRKLKSLLGI